MDRREFKERTQHNIDRIQQIAAEIVRDCGECDFDTEDEFDVDGEAIGNWAAGLIMTSDQKGMNYLVERPAEARFDSNGYPREYERKAIS